MKMKYLTAETENPTQKYNRECRIPNIEKYLTAETGNPPQKFNHPFHLRPTEFVPIVRYRLGINVYSSEGNCPACGQQSDKMGDHALACARSRDRIARHDLLRDLIFEAATNASLAPVKEERHLLPGTVARPGDVFIRRWSDGKDAALDVTLTSPLASSNLAAATARPGGALDSAYDRKMRDTAEDSKGLSSSQLP